MKTPREITNRELVERYDQLSDNNIQDIGLITEMVARFKSYMELNEFPDVDTRKSISDRLKNDKKIQGLEKAVEDYQYANAGDYLRPRYGKLMYNVETRELWTDIFFGMLHEYHNPAVLNLGYMMAIFNKPVTIENVTEFINSEGLQIAIDNFRNVGLVKRPGI